MKRTLLLSVAALAALAVPSANGAPTPQTLTISASTTSLRFGGTVTFSGKLTGAKVDGKTIAVRQDPFPIDGFTSAGSATTNATGDWQLSHKPTVNTRYQARSGKVESPAVDVMVRPAISLKLSDRTPRRGQRVRFSGQLCPEKDGVAIALQRRTAGGWRAVANPVLKDVAGSTCSSFARRLRVRRDGTYRANFPGDAVNVPGNSRAKRANVH